MFIELIITNSPEKYCRDRIPEQRIARHRKGWRMEKTATTGELLPLIVPYYKKNWKIFAWDLFCAALTTICELVLPVLLSQIIDTANHNAALLTISYIGKISGIYIVLRGLEVIARYYMQSIGHIMGARIERDMRADIYAHLQKMSHDYFAKHKTGQLMAHLTTDLFDITEFSHHCPEEYFIGAIKILVSFFVLIRVDWLLTLVIYVMIPLLFFASRAYRKRIRRTQMEQRHQIGEINAGIEDSILGIQVVKSFTNESIEAEKFDRENAEFLSIKERFYYALAGFSSISRIFDGLMLSTILILGGVSLVNRRISPGQFVAFILYAQTLLATVMRIVEFTERFEQGITGLERYRNTLSYEPDIVQKDDAISLDHVRGHIRFDRVSFHYPDSAEQILNKLDLDIPPGKQVAIVGPSGVGKSTLTNLIPRFYDVTGGRLLVDGHDVRDLTLSSLRQSIGMVQQDVYLFSGTIFSNIEYGKPGASREEVEEAARLAGAYDFIRDLPQGFDSHVGERGLMLSGGQKQRISIARVFLKNPPILIMDEATSALDNRSEKWIQKSLESLSRGRTTLTIAHRLSTIRNADEILVLTEKGVEEQGNHEELMARKGIYFDLYQAIENRERKVMTRPLEN